MSDALIETDTADGIGYIRFNRPRQLNAFNNELMRECLAAIKQFDADENVRVIIVSGNGRAFSAGFDLKAAAERQLSGHDEWRGQLELQFDFIMSLWDARVPTIAAVHGYCLAGALELSLAADITFAADDCLFGEPEVRFGSGAVAMLFPWVTGPKAAKELLFPNARREGLSARSRQPVGAGRPTPGGSRTHGAHHRQSIASFSAEDETRGEPGLRHHGA